MGREGGYGCGAADLVRVPFADAMLFPLPDGADPVEWIGFSDMALDAYRCVGPYLTERPGARVLVIGGLPEVIGIYAAGIAVAMGAQSVDFFDSDDVRLCEAAKFGANPIKRGQAEPDGLYEIIVDSSVAPEALIEAFRYVEPEGCVTSCSIHFGELSSAPFMEAYSKGLHYRTGRPNCRAQMEPVAALCCAGAFKPQDVSTQVFGFDDAPLAWIDPALRVVAHRST
jgi:alcohol dehydrogenase